MAIARAQVPEADAATIRRGQGCRFNPTDHDTECTEGRVTVINDAVDPMRRTVEVWCEIANSDGKLRSQVFGSLRIITGQISGIVVVPTSAVQLAEGTRTGFVMVAGADKLAHKRPVETAIPTAGKTPVLEGLTPGEMVIVEGAYGLADGTTIAVVEPNKK